LILILSVCGAQNENFVGIENLKCEYLNNPKGIEKAQPYLSWEIKGRGESNSSESSYRVNCLFLLGELLPKLNPPTTTSGIYSSCNLNQDQLYLFILK